MFLANYFDLKVEKKEIEKYFNEMDKDKSGTLSFDELVEAYTFKVVLFIV
jgi:Ca2+-binding EF-hand superfamily protein